jgi:hypothetical protein
MKKNWREKLKLESKRVRENERDERDERIISRMISIDVEIMTSQYEMI